MGLSENVAVIALIVSLIALLIALGQLTQQILGTADGYRRCAQQVIDPWHRLRWRHFIWGEFRFETHFVTPRLNITPWQDIQDAVGELVCLRDVQAGDAPTPRIWKPWTWWFGKSREHAAQEALAVLSETVSKHRAEPTLQQDHRASSSTDPRTYLKRRTADEEKGASLSRKPSMISVKPERPRSLFQNENKVSWITLIRHVHEVYVGSVRKYRPSTSYLSSSMPDLTHKYDAFDRMPRPSNGTEMQASVAFTESIWDILPNDVSKPLATTTLGTLINLGFRLGMQWRNLDLVASKILADGNGLSMTFTEISGLGLVAKLNKMGNSSAPLPNLTPGRGADKMMFGIIPGAAHLVDQDIACTPENRLCDSWAAIRSTLTEGDELLKLWSREKEPREVINEAVTLLREFLPVPSSNANCHYFWGYSIGGQSCFTFWEGGFAFWRRLKQRQEQIDFSKDLMTVLQHFDHLKDTYTNDFFAINQSRASMASEGATAEERLQKQVNLIEDCRRIFAWTTKWFREHGFHKRDRDAAPFRTPYMHLVAAHCFLACYATIPAVKRLDESKKKLPPFDTQFKHEHYKLGDEKNGVPIKYNFFFAGIYEIAMAYVDNLEHEKFGIVRYMANLELGMPRETCIEAWWVMMLRGLASTICTTTGRKGDAVPSSYHENDTPVWIT